MGKLHSCVGTCTTLSLRELILTSIWSFLPSFKGDGFGVPVNKKQKLINRQCVCGRERTMGKLSSCVGTCTTLSVRKLILTSIWSFLYTIQGRWFWSTCQQKAEVDK